MEMRGGPAYTFFADVCIECVAGKKKWKSKHTTELMAKIASPTDEAFALLLLENAYKVWCDMAKEGNVDGTTLMKPKYTGGKASGGCRRYQGWSDEGIVRYNQLLTTVKRTGRTSKHGRGST
jgi:hypothetical protein